MSINEFDEQRELIAEALVIGFTEESGLLFEDQVVDSCGVLPSPPNEHNVSLPATPEICQLSVPQMRVLGRGVNL